MRAQLHLRRTGLAYLKQAVPRHRATKLRPRPRLRRLEVTFHHFFLLEQLSVTLRWDSRLLPLYLRIAIPVRQQSRGQ